MIRERENQNRNKEDAEAEIMSQEKFDKGGDVIDATEKGKKIVESADFTTSAGKNCLHFAILSGNLELIEVCDYYFK